MSAWAIDIPYGSSRTHFVSWRGRVRSPVLGAFPTVSTDQIAHTTDHPPNAPAGGWIRWMRCVGRSWVRKEQLSHDRFCPTRKELRFVAPAKDEEGQTFNRGEILTFKDLDGTPTIHGGCTLGDPRSKRFNPNLRMMVAT